MPGSRGRLPCVATGPSLRVLLSVRLRAIPPPYLSEDNMDNLHKVWYFAVVFGEFFRISLPSAALAAPTAIRFEDPSESEGKGKP